MSRLVFGEIVNAVHRSVALTMLTNVIDGQRWGIPAGAADSGEEIVGVKDGWYPDDDGWRVNSIGFVSPLSPGAQPYAIAVMTNYQSTPGVRHRDHRGPCRPGIRRVARQLSTL